MCQTILAVNKKMTTKIEISPLMGGAGKMPDGTVVDIDPQGDAATLNKIKRWIRKQNEGPVVPKKLMPYYRSFAKQKF